jgi:hypothetical protein
MSDVIPFSSLSLTSFVFIYPSQFSLVAIEKKKKTTTSTANYSLVALALWESKVKITASV